MEFLIDEFEHLKKAAGGTQQANVGKIEIREAKAAQRPTRRARSASSTEWDSLPGSAIRASGSCAAVWCAANIDPRPRYFAQEVSKPGYSETWVEGMVVLHNPIARKPLPPPPINGASHEFLQEDGRIMSLFPKFHPYFSETIIVGPDTEKNSGATFCADCTAGSTAQCRSNPISDRSLPKTGIFQMSAGDYRRFRSQVVQIRSIETDSQFTKGRNWQALIGFYGQQSLAE